MACFLAKCRNEQCGKFGIVEEPVFALSVVLKNVITRCWACGGIGDVLDGEYATKGNIIHVIEAPERTMKLVRQYQEESRAIAIAERNPSAKRYRAYFDESGKGSNKPVLAVGGYLFEEEAAIAAEEEWKGILDAHGLPFFHMVDCAHGNKVFKNLAGEICVEVEKSCIGVIKTYALFGIVQFVNPNRLYFTEEYRRIKPDWIEPYSLIYVQCVRRMFKIVGRKAVRGNIDFYLEAGNDEQGMVTRALNVVMNTENWIRSTCTGTVRFSTKRENVLVQAADLLVWQATKRIKDMVGEKKRTARRDYVSLLELPHEYIFMRLDKDRSDTKGYGPVAPDLTPLARQFVEAMFDSGEQADAVLAEIRSRMVLAEKVRFPYDMDASSAASDFMKNL